MLYAIKPTLKYMVMETYAKYRVWRYQDILWRTKNFPSQFDKSFPEKSHHFLYLQIQPPFSCLHFKAYPVFITGSNQYGSILGHTSVTTGSLLDDNHWHSVVIERYRRNVNFTLDRHTQHFRTNGEFDHLDLDYEVSRDEANKHNNTNNKEIWESWKVQDFLPLPW